MDINDAFPMRRVLMPGRRFGRGLVGREEVEVEADVNKDGLDTEIPRGGSSLSGAELSASGTRTRYFLLFRLGGLITD